MPKLSQKGVIHFLALFVLVIGLVVTVYLATHPTFFKPKASAGDDLQIVDANGNEFPNNTTDNPNVHLKINLPEGWVVSSPGQSFNFNIVKTVFAQESCKSDCDDCKTQNTCGYTTYDICTDDKGQTGSDLCTNGATRFGCQAGSNSNCQSGNMEYSCANSTQCSQQAAPAQQSSNFFNTDSADTCQTSCGACKPITTCGYDTYDACTDNVGGSSNAGDLCKKAGATKFSCKASGNNNCQSGFEEYECSHSAECSSIDNQPQIVQPASQPKIHIIQKVIVENKDTDGSSGGSSKDEIPLEKLNTLIPWELENLQANQQSAQRYVQVTLFDGSERKQLSGSITLAKPAGGAATRIIDYQGTNNPDQLTEDLLNAREDYTNGFSTLSLENNTEQLRIMKNIAKKRKEELLKELRTNPQAFLEHATLVNRRSMFPQEVQEDIEKEISTQGEISVGHKDNFIEERKEDFVDLETSTGLHSLYFASLPNDLQTGNSVAIQKGISLGSAIAVPKDLSSFKTLSTSQPVDTKNILPGTIKVGVVILKFSETSEAYSENKIKEIMSGPNNSVADYYATNTYGKISIAGNILGTVVVSKNEGECTDKDKNEWTKEADNFIKNTDVTVGADVRNRYYSIAYVLPPSNNCKPLGWAYYGKGRSATRMWIAAKTDETQLMLNIFVHELGHNLFLGHANLRTCDELQNCTSHEYKDIYDPMGLAQDRVFHMNVIHKIQLNSIVPLPVVFQHTENPSRIYKILPIEKSPPLIGPIQENNITIVQALKISQDTSLEDYYLEYRQPINYDKLLPEGITQGVFIHSWTPIERPTNLITITIGKYTYYGVLSDGKLFTDRLNNITIKQLSHDETGVIVEISRGSDEP